MTEQPNMPRMQPLVRVLTAIAACTALLAIAGYVARRGRLFTVLPAWQGMSPVTALVVVLLALAPWFRSTTRWRSVRVAAPGITMATMLAILLSHALYRADLVSPWLAHTLLGMPAAMSGRTSMATASCLLLLSVAALAVRPAAGFGARRAAAVIEIASNAALLIGGAALLGYAYRISDLYGMYVFNTMSLQSALAIVCLALGSLVAEPNTRLGMALRSPSLGVRQVRRMLALTALPAMLGWVFLHLDGPLANTNGAAMALLVMATGVPMFYLLLENARSLELLDRERAAQRAIERRFTDDLADEVARKTAELADSHRREVASLAQAQLAKRTEMIAQLTGTIAHDFNNLLMVIGGYAQLLKLRMRADSASGPLIDKITTTVSGAARLTGQLSAFSRTQRLQATPVHIDRIVRAALADCDSQVPAGVTMAVQLDADCGTVESDSAQLQLAVTHLIRNAWEAIDGAGTVSISTTSSPALNGGRQALIRVADDGCGMTQEQRDNATEPFFTGKPGSHHGLGLAQVNSVVHQASGTMRISSQPGEGTIVELMLPCIAAAEAPSTDQEATGSEAGNRRLLVIDDDDEVRNVIVALLRHMDYEVAEAADGETGLRLLAEHAPAVAIIDYLMPGMNGAEVARRARLAMPDLAIIFISGYADSKAIDAIPSSRLLRKPVLVDELAQSVAGALAPA